VLDRGQRERRVGAVQRAQAGAAGEHARERRMHGVDHDPLLAATVAAQLDFV